MAFKLVDFIALLSGFRKFTIMMLLIVVGIMFRIVGYVDGAEFVDLLKGTAIAFFTANVGEHIMGTIQEWVKNNNSEK
jgi:hypothetical protein